MEAIGMSTRVPRVSIGMPVYNEERYVSRALDTILAQDFPAFELVISDNGSTDRTPEICRAYASGDVRIRYIRHDENRGASWNFKRVFECCNGEYFMWAGSHDLWLPTFISSCVSVLEAEPDTVLVYTRTRVVDGEESVILQETPDMIDTRGEGLKKRVLKIVNDLYWCNMLHGLFRRSMLERCRHGLVCRGPDHVLLMEVSLQGAIAQIPEVLFLRRENRQAESTELTEPGYSRQQLLRLDPHALDDKALRPFWRMGLEHLKAILRAPIPIRAKGALLLSVAAAFYTRWHAELKRELFAPVR